MDEKNGNQGLQLAQPPLRKSITTAGDARVSSLQPPKLVSGIERARMKNVFAMALENKKGEEE